MINITQDYCRLFCVPIVTMPSFRSPDISRDMDCSMSYLHICGEGWEGGRERGREGGKEEGREGVREGGREGERV